MSPMRTLKNRLVRIEIWLCLAWARFLIKYVPFRRWRAILGPIDGELPPEQRPQLSPAQSKKACDIGRLVNRIANRVRLFEAVCLPRAMVGRWVLARRGLPSRIIIGTRRGDLEEGLLFHAWLMVGDEIVTGEDERVEFLSFAKTAASGEIPLMDSSDVS